MSKQPRRWKQLERHPLSAEYPDITGAAWEEYVQGVREFGIIDGRKVVLHEGKVIDAWQLLRACIEADTKPIFVDLKLPKGMTVEQWVEIKNDNRRHETMEVMMARAVARRERVAAAREEGKSLRAIAEEEDVSQATIRKDIKASGAHGAHLPEKVTGKDGKEYPSERPKPAAGLPGPQIPDRFKNRGLTVTPSANGAVGVPTWDKSRAAPVVHAIHEAYESLQQALEGSESVFKAALAKQQKKLALVQADIDLILEKAPSGKFTKPTVDEVAAYCKERGNKVDAETFVDHYTANGWKVGKNAMKDWKASVRTWEKNDHGKGSRNGRTSRVEAPEGKYANVGRKIQA